MRDWHSHWLPPTLLRGLERRTVAPRVLRIRGVPHLLAGRGCRRLDPPSVDLDARLDLLRHLGISWQMLSLSCLWNIDSLPVAQALPLVQAFNDDTAEAIAQAPAMLGGLAALPLQDLDAACAELRRARAAGLSGAILPSGIFATLAAAQRYAPLLRQADSLGAHLFVHPGQTESQEEVAPAQDNWWFRRIVLDTQHQLTSAMLTLVSSPLLQDYPHLSVQLANLGGALPFYLERLRAVAADDPGGEGTSRIFEPARITVDSASFGPRAVGLAREALGADKVVLGTDMPIFDARRAMEGFCRATENFR